MLSSFNITTQNTNVDCEIRNDEIMLFWQKEAPNIGGIHRYSKVTLQQVETLQDS